MKNARTSLKFKAQRTQQKTKVQKSPQTPDNKEFVEVLYQKMGDRWFAFSLVEGEIFMGSIPQSELDPTDLTNK